MTALSEDEDMRQRADWMTRADDQILEAVEEYGNLQPKSIDNLDICARQWASTRLRYLRAAGLLEQVASTTGLYGITEAGEAYLAGQFDASQLPDPTPDEPEPDDDDDA